jgi:hypothetical protein
MSPLGFKEAYHWQAFLKNVAVDNVILDSTKKSSRFF